MAATVEKVVNTPKACGVNSRASTGPSSSGTSCASAPPISSVTVARSNPEVAREGAGMVRLAGRLQASAACKACTTASCCAGCRSALIGRLITSAASWSATGVGVLHSSR